MIKKGKELFSDVPVRILITAGGILLIVMLMAATIISTGPPIRPLDTVAGLPVHPLVVHATIISIATATAGTIALALRPMWRHRYGYLLIWIMLGMIFTTWVAVESGNILTEYPGLGSTEHADGGRVLLIMVIPFAILSALMVVLDRFWLVKTNVHGDLYRRTIKKVGKPTTWHKNILRVVCVLASIMAVVVMVQSIIVGHSGAEASWGDILP